MDIASASALAAFSYRTGLESGNPGEALFGAFRTVAAASAQATAPLPAAGDATLAAGPQAAGALAAYQLAGQAGLGGSAITALLAATPSTEQLLAAGLGGGTAGGPLNGPGLAAAVSAYAFIQGLQSGQSPAELGRQAAAAALQQGNGMLNLLA